MSSDERVRQSVGFRSLMQGFSIFMTLFYIGAGIYLFFNGEMLPGRPEVRKIFAGLIAFYGVYRGVRAYMEFFKKRD